MLFHLKTSQQLDTKQSLLLSPVFLILHTISLQMTEIQFLATSYTRSHPSIQGQKINV